MRRRLVLSLVASLCVLALGSCTLQTAGAPKGPARFYARFKDVQELVVGHTVRMSDVTIGTVLGIKLDGYEAVVKFTVEKGHKLPQGTTASISSTSLLGENYIDLRPPADAANEPALRSGATLPTAGGTATVEELAVQLLGLTRALQGRDVAAIVNAGAQGLGTRGDELHQLIGTVGSVTDTLARQSDAFDALLTNLDGLLKTLAPGAGNIGKTIDLAADATGSLARQRTRLVTLVQNLTELAATLDAKVLAPHRAQLTRIIADLAPVVGTITDDRDKLIRTIEQLVVVTQRLPTAIHDGGVVGYAWLDDFSYGGMTLQTTEFGRALGQLLTGHQP